MQSLMSAFSLGSITYYLIWSNFVLPLQDLRCLIHKMGITFHRVVVSKDYITYKVYKMKSELGRP